MLVRVCVCVNSLYVMGQMRGLTKRGVEKKKLGEMLRGGGMREEKKACFSFAHNHLKGEKQ